MDRVFFWSLKNASEVRTVGVPERDVQTDLL